MDRSLPKVFSTAVSGLLLLALSMSNVSAQSRVSVGVTETIETANPY